jgi:PIN domain nuclease of toxin-antitoxin system
VKYLLDTHVVIWWLTNDRKLSKGHAKLLERSERSGMDVGLSAISLWEIAKLVERGRLELTQSVDDSLEQLETSAFLTILPLTGRVAVESTRLGARFHSDPIDQVIVATARCHGLTLLTVDERIVESGVVAVA